MFDTKFCIAVRDDLAQWQKLNVTAFLCGGLTGAHGEVVGEPYRDGSGEIYAPLVRQPILIFKASREELTRTLARALSRNVRAAIYTEELFATGNDADNRAEVVGVPTDELNLVGLGLFAERKPIDKITKGLKLHD